MKNVQKLILTSLCVFPINVVFAQAPTVDTSRQQLQGTLTPEMMAAPLIGRVPPTTQMTLTIGLKTKNTAELMDAAEQVSDPNSSYYQEYMTPEQFADLYGATPAEYQSLLDWGRSNNLTVTAHENRLAATVVGSVADIESALNIHMTYGKRADGTQFFAPDAEPSINLAVPVENISGLENFARPTRAGGSGPGGSYQGTDFRNAYAPTMTLTGAGQKVGIFMFDGFAQSDINGYASQTKQSFLPVQTVPAKVTMTPGEEGTLDVEMALSMAPAAQVVAFVGNSGTVMLTNMTDRPDIKEFSSSWFWYNGTTTDTNLMAELALQGQSFFQASGDGGAYPVGVFPKYKSGSLDCRQFPYITIVGGTSLDMSDNGADYGTLETAWPDSSGGIESSVALPSYQSGIAGHNGASATHRNVPDVSMQAADARIFFKGAPTQVAGTSEATPLWAGYMALVNQLSAEDGKASAGFANPALYHLASTSDYGKLFHDIVSGCTPDSTGNEYCAGPGYDLTTGLGSPKDGLINALSGVASFPLYCQGPLVTSSGLTPFKWASTGAGTKSPGPGECAWADRAPRGTEIKAGDGNVISGQLSEVANLKSGEYAEIGVFNDSKDGNDMVVTQVVGLVKPPFSSSPTLP
jgi:subtilase family serine protease